MSIREKMEAPLSRSQEKKQAARKQKIAIMIEVHQEPPAPTSTEPGPGYGKPSLEQKVRDALEIVDSGHKSDVEWAYIKKVYQQLRPQRDMRSREICEMIEPILQKYDIHVAAKAGENK